jgi:hypothetical protein
MDILFRLQKWYAAQCDGDWEHSYGVHITTLDNPGWLVKIDLIGTELESRPFVAVSAGTGKDDHPEQTIWLSCTTRDGVWQGAGDETQLVRILAIFLDWAEALA